MRPHVSQIAFGIQQTIEAVGEFIHYRSGPANITVQFHSVTAPAYLDGSGKSHEVPLSPGIGFKLKAGHRFKSLTIINDTNTGETRIEMLAGFGEYILGPEPVELAISSPRLDYSAHLGITTDPAAALGIFLANHVDSSHTLYCLLASDDTADQTVNSILDDALGLWLGKNDTSAGSTDKNLLVSVDLATGVVLGAPSNFRALTTDTRFPTTRSQAFVGSANYTGGIANVYGNNNLLYQPNSQLNTQQLDATRQWIARGTPAIIAPGYTLALKTSLAAVGRKRLQGYFQWYELPIGS